MTSKSFKEKNSQENYQIMFQICALNQNIQGKEFQCYVLETFSKCND
jgi:hypothetical protein